MMVIYLNKKYLFHFMEKKEKLNGDNKIYLNRIENENLFVELRSSEKIGQDIGYQFFFLTILINIFLFLNLSVRIFFNSISLPAYFYNVLLVNSS